MNQVILMITICAFLSYGITFEKTSGVDVNDYGYSVSQTNDDCYIVTGGIYSDDGDSTFVWLVKTDSLGNFEWDKTYGISSYNCGKEVQPTIDGGYIIVGQSGNQMMLLKTDSLGNEEWIKTFNDGESAEGNSVLHTSDNGFLVTGNITFVEEEIGGDIYYTDVWVIKTDYFGSIEWNDTYSRSAFEGANHVIGTSDSSYVITGWRVTSPGNSKLSTLIKIDHSGNELWYKSYGETDSDVVEFIGESVHEYNGDSFYIIGSTNALGLGSYDILLIKTDLNGEEIWTKTFGTSSYDSGSSLELTSDNSIVLSGSCDGDICLIKTDIDGNEIWFKSFDFFDDSDVASSIQQTNDNGFIVTGWTRRNDYNDLFLIKTDENGITSINSDQLTITNFELHQNYPNPFNPVTKIKYTLQNPSLVKLNIFNIQGKLVSTLVNRKEQKGLHQVNFDGSELPSGLYYYSLTVDGIITHNKKMLIVK